MYYDNKCFSIGCWEEDPHERPTFPALLAVLDEIAQSTFTTTPHDSFRTMQGHWQMEIEEKVTEIKTKETVRHNLTLAIWPCIVYSEMIAYLKVPPSLNPSTPMVALC